MNTGGGQNFNISTATKLKIGAGVKAHQRNLSPDSLKKWKEQVRNKHLGKQHLNIDSKLQISESLKTYYSENKQSDLTKDKRSTSRRKRGIELPRFVNVRQYAAGPVYCVSKHPKCKYKQFNNLEDCLNYLFILDLPEIIMKLRIQVSDMLARSINMTKNIDYLLDQVYKLRNWIADSIEKEEKSPETKC